MKIFHFGFYIFAVSLLASCASDTSDEVKDASELEAPKNFEVVLASDSHWDGEIFPAAGSCTSLGGMALTPSLVVKKAPAGTNVILLEFNNLSIKGLDKDGGLGTVGYVYEAPADGSEVVLRPVQGGKVELPYPAFLERNHRVPNALPAAYYAPCLKRGFEQEISVTAKAIKRTGDVYKQNSEVLEEVVIPLGVLKN